MSIFAYNSTSVLSCLGGGLAALCQYFGSCVIYYCSFQVLTSVCATITVVAMDYQNVGIVTDYDVVELLAELTNVVSYTYNVIKQLLNSVFV